MDQNRSSYNFPTMWGEVLTQVHKQLGTAYKIDNYTSLTGEVVELVLSTMRIYCVYLVVGCTTASGVHLRISFGTGVIGSHNIENGKLVWQAILAAAWCVDANNVQLE